MSDSREGRKRRRRRKRKRRRREERVKEERGVLFLVKRERADSKDIGRVATTATARERAAREREGGEAEERGQAVLGEEVRAEEIANGEREVVCFWAWLLSVLGHGIQTLTQLHHTPPILLSGCFFILFFSPPLLLPSSFVFLLFSLL